MDLLFIGLNEYWNSNSLILVLMMLGSGIIAFTIGWISQSIKLKKLLNHLKKYRKENKTIKSRLAAIEDLELKTFEENIKCKKLINALEEENERLKFKTKTQTTNVYSKNNLRTEIFENKPISKFNLELVKREHINLEVVPNKIEKIGQSIAKTFDMLKGKINPSKN